MKTLIIVILLTLPFIVFCQLEGVYRDNPQYGIGTRISLFEDGTFDYSHNTGCALGNSIGLGKYIIEDKKLTLVFDNPFEEINKEQKNAYYEIEKRDLFNENVTIDIKVLDYENEGEPLIGATIILNDTNKQHICCNDTIHDCCTLTDINGFAQLNIPAGIDIENGLLSISYTGYKTMEIPIALDDKYDIKAYCVYEYDKYEEIIINTVISKGITMEFKVEREDGEIFMTRIDYPNAARIKFYNWND